MQPSDEGGGVWGGGGSLGGGGVRGGRGSSDFSELSVQFDLFIFLLLQTFATLLIVCVQAGNIMSFFINGPAHYTQTPFDLCVFEKIQIKSIIK